MAQPALTDWLERKPKKKAKKRINPVSKRRREQLKEYKKLREKFLLENPCCAVWLYVHGKTGRVMETPFASEIHHRRGRTGERLTDTTYWFAVSRWGHEYIHNNPKWAYDNGFLLPR